jgi:hypothetical protein
MRDTSISEQIQSRSVLLVESSIPPHLTLAEWRHRRRVPRYRPQAGLAAIRRALERVHRRAGME